MGPTEPGSWINENGVLRPNENDEAMAERYGLKKSQADAQASAEGGTDNAGK